MKMMNLIVLPFISLFLFHSAFSQELQRDEKWVRGYFNNLRQTYDKRVAPLGDEGTGPVKVALSMYILDISEVDDSKMDYTAQFYFRQSWNDSRLRFTDKTENIILRDTEDVWTPDLFFTGGRESRLEHIVHPNAFLRIKPTGEVLYSIRVTVKFSCQMDLSYFPHDIQECRMTIESYGHVRKEIELEWQSCMAIGAFQGVTLHNFDLIGFDQSEKEENFTFGQYKVLVVKLTFQRKFGFFAIKLYVPFILLVILSLLSLWIKAEERGIRLSLLVLILYFMTNIAVEVSDNIPPAPYTKGTDVWIGFCESLVFAVFLEFIAVALIAGRHDGEISESKGRILPNIESDSKGPSMKSNFQKSDLCKLLNMFDTRNGGKGKRDAAAFRVDKIFRFVFPFIFIIFNAVYWSVYCCNSTE